MSRLHDLGKELVAPVKERLLYDFVGSAVVVALQILDVLENRHVRILGVHDTEYVIKEIAVLISEALLLPGYRKRLARETSTENIEVGK